ncbi:MAG: molybdopterin cofactor-binding domain-containing protein [Pseudomonadota bacterium]
MSAGSVSRRVFLKATALTGGGMVISFPLSGPLSADQNPNTLTPNAFLELTADNRVLFTCPREEMGQGVDTGLATLVAEELDVAPARIEIVRSSADSAYANPDIGLQVTGGSTSIKAHYLQLRQVGADVRALLLDAAAQDLGTERTTLSTGDAHVITEDGEHHPYGRFLATAAGLPMPDETPLKSPEAFNYIGKHFPRLDALSKSTGTAVYSIDIDFPGLHYAVVLRSPVAGGQLQSLQSREALGMPGATEVVEISTGAAVVAESFWQAKQAASKLSATWTSPALQAVDSAQVRADFGEALASAEGVTTAQQGDPHSEINQASVVIDSEFYAPYLAHAPMEPLNAVVSIDGDKVDVWSGTQGPAADQGLVARALGMKKEDVRVHGTLMGGAFGRRGTVNHVVEAAEIARATGRPIQIVWTREDDIRHGVYRPASLMRIRAGLDKAGIINSWHATRVGGNMMPTSIANQAPGYLPTFVPQGLIRLAANVADKAFTDWTVDHSSIEGLHEDYDLPHREVTHITVDHGLPLTFWRSVGHSYTAFAVESMIDELASVSGLDAVEFRIRNSSDNPRFAEVVRRAGEYMRSAELEEGHHLGLAAHSSFGTPVAEVAEVSVESNTIRVHKVLCVLDCGTVVNPDIVRAQMEGSVMFALTAALHGELHLKDGAIVQSNFHDYPILRMNEAPDIDVIIVDSNAHPSGVGEPAVPPTAPAVANAVYAATGKRLRELPLRLS